MSFQVNIYLILWLHTIPCYWLTLFLWVTFRKWQAFLHLLYFCRLIVKLGKIITNWPPMLWGGSLFLISPRAYAEEEGAATTWHMFPWMITTAKAKPNRQADYCHLFKARYLVSWGETVHSVLWGMEEMFIILLKGNEELW